MEIYALDKEFKLVSIGIPFTNLQWNRRYYECGDFEMQLSINDYDPSWAYIGTNARPELGMAQKLQITGVGDTSMLVSGFFCEKMLDDKVCYPKWKSSTKEDVGVPQYEYIGAENIARQAFLQFKKGIPVELGTNTNLAPDFRDTTTFEDSQLGEALYSFLETFEMSYRVGYDYLSDDLTFRVWQGVDRTSAQNENGWQVFSSDFGNLAGKTVDIDESGYKNYAIIPIMYGSDNEYNGETLYLDKSDGGYKKELLIDRSADFPDEYTTEAQFKESVLQDAAEELATYDIVESIDIQVIGNEGYMTDYDLGDKCDIELSDIGVTTDSRIVEINEVFKPEDYHSVTIGLGNKRIDNIRRAVRR